MFEGAFENPLRCDRIRHTCRQETNALRATNSYHSRTLIDGINRLRLGAVSLRLKAAAQAAAASDTAFPKISFRPYRPGV
jgi:hypothetical protein